MMILRLVECTDYDISYGFLIIENDKGITDSDVQDKINEIKGKFADEGFGDWTVDDVVDEMPEEWEAYTVDDCIVDI